MKFTLAVAALLGLTSAITITSDPNVPFRGGSSDLTRTNSDKELTPEHCNAEDGLYKPYNYKGHCLNPPLLPGLPSCPVDERKVMQDGKTLAIPYPKAHYNCNPYGIAAF